jgi:hypothetical protein
LSIPAKRRDPWAAWVSYLDGLDWKEGETKHAQAYSAAIRAGTLEIAPGAARAEIERRIRGAGGRVVPRDLDRQMERGYAYARKEATQGEAPVATSVTRSYFSAAELVTRADRARDFTWADLMRRSPIDPDSVTSGQYLEKVFKPGEAVVICEHRKDPGRVYMVGSHATWVCGLGSEEGIFYLSNPTDGAKKPNAENTLSVRSEANVTAYRHLVVESDKSDALLWVRAMVQVPLPVVAIYGSGGKSVHFLLRVNAADKVEYLSILDRLQPGLVRLGADPASMSGVRLTRLPGARRGEKRQRLLYLDPEACGDPIVQRPERPMAAGSGQMFGGTEVATFTADEWTAELSRRKANRGKWGMQYE